MTRLAHPGVCLEAVQLCGDHATDSAGDGLHLETVFLITELYLWLFVCPAIQICPSPCDVWTDALGGAALASFPAILMEHILL